jgi:hypothetical protein
MERNKIAESRNFLAELEHKISCEKQKENEDLRKKKHKTKAPDSNSLVPKKNNTADIFLSHDYTRHSRQNGRDKLLSINKTFKN